MQPKRNKTIILLKHRPGQAHRERGFAVGSSGIYYSMCERNKIKILLRLIWFYVIIKMSRVSTAFH